MVIKVKTNSARATERLGEKFSKKYLLTNSCNIVALIGEFGSGKTTFVKGIAKGLKINKCIQSPSFVTVKEYKLPQREGNFYHIDLFRLQEEEIYTLNYQEFLLDKNAITVIEWAEHMKSILQNIPHISIKFKIIKKNKREIEINDEY